MAAARPMSKTCEANPAVYAELEPMDRHRSFIDHLFVLRDRGRLTGVGRNLFASPFSEIALVGRRPHDDDARDNDGERSPGRLSICRHASDGDRAGMVFTAGCSEFDAAPSTSMPGDAALAGLSEPVTATDRRQERSPFDPIIGALDGWIEQLRLQFRAAARAAPAPEIASALEDALCAPGLDRGTSVASLAATVGVVPRTLQRHFRNRTGLAPKRYAAVAGSGASLDYRHPS